MRIGKSKIVTVVAALICVLIIAIVVSKKGDQATSDNAIIDNEIIGNEIIGINANIPADMVTSEELIELTQQYNEPRGYVDKVSMELEPDHKGLVEIWYGDKIVNIDTKNKKILNYIMRDKSIEDEEFTDSFIWEATDSDEAIEIAQEVLKKDPELEVTKIHLTGQYKEDWLDDDHDHVWEVVFLDENKQKAYSVTVDAILRKVEKANSFYYLKEIH